MKARAAMLLARPAAAAERGRFLLIAAAAAAAGGLLIAAARVARMAQDQLELYFSDDGMRPGVLAAAVLLVIPVSAFAVQALRVGSITRDRRMAALRLAGATPRDVRTVAAAEAGAAALVGCVFAVWAYVLLWLVLGVLPPADLRLLPGPDVVDVAVWIAVAALLGAGGAVAGAGLQQRVVTEPLGVFRRAHVRGPGRVSLGAAIAGPALAASCAAWEFVTNVESILPWLGVIVGAVMSAAGAGPRLVRAGGRRLRRQEGVEELLAGWPVEAEPQAAARVAVVLILCGVGVGLELVYLPVWFYGANVLAIVGVSTGETGGHLLALAGLATLVALVVAVLTLIVGIADQLVDARRPLATLAALGVDEAALAPALERQLSAVALAAVALPLVLLTVWSDVPLARSLAAAALVMAASLLTPVEPVDGGALAATGGTAAGLAGIGLAVLLVLGLV